MQDQTKKLFKNLTIKHAIKKLHDHEITRCRKRENLDIFGEDDVLLQEMFLHIGSDLLGQASLNHLQRNHIVQHSEGH